MNSEEIKARVSTIEEEIERNRELIHRLVDKRDDMDKQIDALLAKQDDYRKMQIKWLEHPQEQAS